MLVFDTDTLTLLFLGHAQVHRRIRSVEAVVATTITTCIEVLKGPFPVGASRLASGYMRR
jgi:hypothetical protein